MTISVELFPGLLQSEQKHTGKWREAKKPTGARYLVGSTMAPKCKRRYPVQCVAVATKAEEAKTVKYGDLTSNNIFQPVDVEHLGGLGKETGKLVKTLCDEITKQTDDKRSGALFIQIFLTCARQQCGDH